MNELTYDFEIQAYWGTKVRSALRGTITPEEIIKEHGQIIIATVIINGEQVADVTYDGKKVGLEPPVEPPADPSLVQDVDSGNLYRISEEGIEHLGAC